MRTPRAEALFAAVAIAGSGANAAVAQRAIVVLKTPSLAQRVGAAKVDFAQQLRWTKAARSAQRLLLARLAAQGLVVHPEETFVRVLDGFSANLPPAAVPIVERDRDVAGVYPVRAAYPATVRAAHSAEPPSPLASAHIDGRGVTVALLGRASMAGILARVAPGASILPIGIPLPARSDELIAGLDRAAGHARVALVAFEEPFAGFPDGPEAQAVAGARALDLLVVTYGDIAAPGGSPDALTVSAFDTRPTVVRARVVVRSGLQTLVDVQAPLATSSRHALELRVVRAYGPLTSFFTPAGGSIVAGRAALVPVGSARAAEEAGASAVLLYGRVPPELSGSVPVVSLDARAAHAVLSRLAAGARVTVALGPQIEVVNPDAGRVAPFSSTGLAYDGSVKPDLVAPGVDGSGAAAAIVAGDAALLAQARASLGADALAGLLIGTARAVPGEPVTAQGAGAVDVGAAAAAEIVASPPTLARGLSAFTLTNLSSRALAVTVRAAYVTIPAGRSARVRIPAVTTGGAVIARVAGGGAIRIPWAIAEPHPVGLIRSASLTGAVLTVDAGRVLTLAGRREIRPVIRLDVELRHTGGPTLGLLARLRDVLPGRYTFGLTGRGPDGRPLPPGRYVVTVLAYPVGGGPPSRRMLRFVRR